MTIQPIVRLILRKYLSALWRLKQSVFNAYKATIKHLVEALTEKYWVTDYLPAFKQEHDGILLIRLDLIGDFVLWLDSAQAYRRLYPNRKITLAVNSACIDLAEALPHWDEVISLNVQRLRTDYIYRLCMLVKLKQGNFAVAIQPTFSREFVGDLALRASCATERIGYVGDANNIPIITKSITDHWYTKLITNDLKNKMELNINAHFVRELGCHDFLSSTPVIHQKITLPDDLRFNTPYVVIAPGASWRSKMWPVEHFADLIKHLVLKFDGRIILCGGPSDRDACAEIKRLVFPIALKDLACRTSLPELLEVIRHAELLITNDSAPVHLAAAVSTPSICILGGGHFGRFLPYATENQPTSPTPVIATYEMDCYNCRWHCRFDIADGQAAPCIANIAVLSVYDACCNLLTQD